MTMIDLRDTFRVVSCGGGNGCDVTFAMTDAFYREAMDTGRSWYCPNGHCRVFSDDTTEAKLEQSKAREVALKDQLGAAVREAEAMRVELLRARTRFANGVCPCCSRAFENVRRHMSSKHPDYDRSKVESSSGHLYQCSCGRGFGKLQGLRIHQTRQRPSDWFTPTSRPWRAHLTEV